MSEEKDEESIKELEQTIEDMEARTGDLPEWLDGVQTWMGYIDAAGAQELLARNVPPQKGVAGTNRPQVSGAVPVLAQDMLEGRWYFSHQGIAFNVKGELIDGQHRLTAFLAAEAQDPGLMLPIMITWNLPIDSNEKIDINRRRQPGTFLAMAGHASASRLGTTLKWLRLYDTANFDEPLSKAHWTQTFDVPTLRKILVEHPLATEGVNIGGQLQSLLTPSATAAGWVLARENYTQALVDEFIDGVKEGAKLDSGDPRLAMRNWAINRKDRGTRAIAYVHLAFFLKAFNSYRRNETVQTLTFKPSVERFPRV